DGQPAFERCPRCQAPALRRPAVGGAGLVVRKNERGHEVLLVRRAATARFGAGKWCIPCGYVEWGEDVRDAVRRELREECGIDVEVLEAFDVQSNFHDQDRLTV